MYICDYDNNRIQRWTLGASAGTTIAGSPVTTNGITLTHPNYLTLDKYGALYVSGNDLDAVVRFLPGSYNATRVAGVGSPGTMLSELDNPTDVVVDENQTMYVVEDGNKRVTRWPYNSKNGTVAISSNLLEGATGILFVPGSSTQVYICNERTDSVYIWNFGDPAPITTLQTVNHSSNSLNRPWGMTLDGYGNLYVADRDNDRVVMFVPNATIGIPVVVRGSTGPTLDKPVDVALDSQLNLYVAVEGHMIIKYART